MVGKTQKQTMRDKCTLTAGPGGNEDSQYRICYHGEIVREMITEENAGQGK